MVETAERLAALRELGGVSQQELGRLAGLSPRTVGMIEGRGGTMSGGTAGAVAAVLGTTTDYLLTGSGAKPAQRTVRRAVTAARGAWMGANGG